MFQRFTEEPLDLIFLRVKTKMYGAFRETNEDTGTKLVGSSSRLRTYSKTSVSL